MVFPDVSLESSAGEGLPRHRHDAALLVSASVACRGNDEADLGALFPERPAKFVIEKESIVAPPSSKQLDRIVKAGPGGVDRLLKPFAKLEIVRAGLANDNAKEFLPGRSISSFPQVP